MSEQQPAVNGEHRLLPSLVVVVLAIIPLLLPSAVFPGAANTAGVLAIALLVAVVAVDPGRIDRRSGLTRSLSITLTIVLVTVSAIATITLVAELIDGAPDLDSASTLLLTGALVWIDTNFSFSLLYWELDCGGAAQRLHEGRAYPDLAVPQDLDSGLARPGWRPTIVDYLYLGFTNATAFSPTDVMPLRHWAKLIMAAQAMISIVLLSLVIANAVNILG